jgi:hypothetical protein
MPASATGELGPARLDPGGILRLKNPVGGFKFKQQPTDYARGNTSACGGTGRTATVHQLRGSQPTFRPFLFALWCAAEFICHHCPVRTHLCRGIHLPPSCGSSPKSGNGARHLANLRLGFIGWRDHCGFFLTRSSFLGGRHPPFSRDSHFRVFGDNDCEDHPELLGEKTARSKTARMLLIMESTSDVHCLAVLIARLVVLYSHSEPVNRDKSIEPVKLGV